MGMYGQLVRISPAAYEKLREDHDAKKIYEMFSGSDSDDRCELDKMWHGLCYLMSGTSDVAPDFDLPLSAAVLGHEALSDDEMEMLMGNDPEMVQTIANEIGKLDIDQKLAEVDFDAFDQKMIYPVIWTREDPQVLKQELHTYFDALKDFYLQASASHQAVLVLIS